MFADAIAALEKGDVIAVPTEAVYGLSADPHNLSAVQKLIDLKKRNPDKGLILVASDFVQLAPFLTPLSADVLARISATWPGPHTWLVTARSDVSPLLRGKHQTLAVRVTAHPVMSALCQQFGGALVSSSANPEGLSPALTESAIREYFGNDLLIAPGALGGLSKPTQIRDALTGEVIRV